MKIAEALSFDIVVMNLSRAKRNLIVVLLFVGWLFLAVLLAVIFNSKIVMPFCIIPFVFLVMFVSNKAMKLKRIGSITMMAEEVVLENEVLNLKRNIAVKEIKSVFIRGGARTNLSGTLKRLTLFLDITLKDKELVVVHFKVPADDVATADAITEYCRSLGIKCDRKI